MSFLIGLIVGAALFGGGGGARVELEPTPLWVWPLIALWVAVLGWTAISAHWSSVFWPAIEAQKQAERAKRLAERSFQGGIE